MAIYVGFNTINNPLPPYTLTDIQLVKQDILNTFNTRVGERVMLPEFGSIIHDMIYEPLDDIAIDAIYDDVRRVIGLEPRVELLSDPVLTEMESGIRIEVELNFLPQDTAEHLLIDFERENDEAI